MAKSSKRKSIHKLDKYLRDHQGDKFHITLIGVGGTGSHILANLAAINSVQSKLDGRLIHVNAFDPGEVKRHNVGKQTYYDPDNGANKAVQAIGRINRTYGFDWTGHPTPFKGHMHNIVITAVDSWETRKIVWREIENTKGSRQMETNPLYWLDVGNGPNDGQAILWSRSQPRKMYSVVDYSKGSVISTELERESCSMLESLNNQGMFINKFMATVATEMLYKLLYNQQIDHNAMIVNLDSMRMIPIPL